MLGVKSIDVAQGTVLNDSMQMKVLLGLWNRYRPFDINYIVVLQW